MSTIIPENEGLKKAIRWIAHNLKDDKNAVIITLIQQAALKFNLSPKHSMFLHNFYFNQDQDKAH